LCLRKTSKYRPRESAPRLPEGGIWDEAEDSGFPDGPIGMFVLSPFAKTNYQNSIHYDHSSMLKTFQEIFGVAPLLGGAANPATNDLSDFFLP
jgi:hypothetical protein